MASPPRDRHPDSTLALALDGYEFVSKRCDRYGSELFEARLAFKKTVCMRGEAAARVFYDPGRFVRAGAAPKRIQKTLFGQGGVQGLDGAAHLRRKQLFMSLMTPERISSLASLTADGLDQRLRAWQKLPHVVLFEGIGRVLCEAACAWVGLPLEAADVRQRTDELHAMIEGGGSVGPRYWQARSARKRCEQWAETAVERVRTGALDVLRTKALHAVAWHRDLDGELLTPKVAAVELLNLVRPTVAIGRFVVFAALALHDHPDWRERWRTADDDVKHRFVQEVRRFYPFFPFVGARVRTDFSWRGYRFRAGQRALLDLYGSNHDPKLWAEPDQFDPDRFRGWSQSPFAPIPQGGGDYEHGHRCAGEWATIAVLKTAIDALTSVDYDVPDQDLRVSLRRMPTLPRSGFVLTNVRARVPARQPVSSPPP